MPRGSISSVDEIHNLIRSALTNAGFSYWTDRASCGSAGVYTIIDLPDGLAKKHIYFRTNGNYLYVGACDSIVFWDEYDDETGEFICRHCDITGDVSFYYSNMPTGEYVFNAESNGVMAIASVTTDVKAVLIKLIDENNEEIYIYGLNGFKAVKDGVYDISFFTASYWDGNDGIAYKAGIIRGGGVVLLTDKFMSPVGNVGEVIQYSPYSGYWVNCRVISVPGDGSEGTNLGVIRFKEPYFATPDLNTTLPLMTVDFYAFATLDINFTIPLELLTIIYIYPSEALDKRVAEMIEEQPYNFPTIGEVVLERSKRIITRLELSKA